MKLQNLTKSHHLMQVHIGHQESIIQQKIPTLSMVE